MEQSTRLQRGHYEYELHCPHCGHLFAYVTMRQAEIYAVCQRCHRKWAMKIDWPTVSLLGVAEKPGPSLDKTGRPA
jgi:uncharacterized paraquat-inducible protein A